MKKNQFLLLKLAEECAEVAHRASKQIQFGKDEIQNGHEEVNSQRLRSEVLDLYVIVGMLVNSGEIQNWTDIEYFNALRRKQEKMQKYLNKSYDLGQLPEIVL